MPSFRQLIRRLLETLASTPLHPVTPATRIVVVQEEDPKLAAKREKMLQWMRDNNVMPLVKSAETVRGPKE